MKHILGFFRSFTVFEGILFSGSVAAVVLSFVLLHNTDYLNLVGALLGVCGLILVAKGNVAGQAVCVLFSLYYGYVSFLFRYYGEMITYLGMTAPIAVAAVVAWFRHPSDRGRIEVEVRSPPLKEYFSILLLDLGVTVAFYFLLGAFETRNLAWSTVSVTTSFAAVLLTARRSPFYALAYALNDVVLIVLWALAAREDPENYALVTCFCAFLLNDLYGFFNWLRMQRRQRNTK